MNPDDLLNNAWHEAGHPVTPTRLAASIRSHQWRHRLQRAIEFVLTAAAILLFCRSLVAGNLGAAHWLLVPFFALYLPIAWALILRVPGRREEDVTESTAVYARLRMSQLRINLRDLWLARWAALGLLGYALIAGAFVWSIGNPNWKDATLTLLGFSLAWVAGTLWIVRKLRRSRLREYRAVRRVNNAQ